MSNHCTKCNVNKIFKGCYNFIVVKHHNEKKYILTQNNFVCIGKQIIHIIIYPYKSQNRNTLKITYLTIYIKINLLNYDT